MSSKVEYCLIVAMANNRGIGFQGKLPWKISGDMAFFKKITTHRTEKDRENIVVMGRKTWESIPNKFRPLKDRRNFVISSRLTSVPEGVHVFRSHEDVIKHLQQMSEPRKVFFIGGSRVYEKALSTGCCDRIYLTRVFGDFECDTFMPELDEKAYQLITDPEVDGSLQKDDSVEYKFEVYDKTRRVTEVSVSKASPPVLNICAAMSSNRGIGKDGKLPWPPIKKDFENYMRLTSSVIDPGKFVVNLKGRVTWEGTCEEEKTRAGILNIIISKSLRECPQHVYEIVPSWEDAIRLIYSPPLVHKVEKVWVMGGVDLYKRALASHHLHKVYLTKIQVVCESDTFFPELGDEFELVGDEEVDSSGHENGITFQTEVYQRKAT